MKNENLRIFKILKLIMVTELICAIFIQRFIQEKIISLNFLSDNIGIPLFAVMLFTFLIFFIYWKIKKASHFMFQE